MTMQRRQFLESCAAMTGAAGFCALPAWANAPPRMYERTRLVDAAGVPLRTRALVAQTNYVFHFPFVGTPCFLLHLGRTVVASAALRQEDGTTYAWQGGVGPSRAVVAFSAICAHKLAYPTRDVSFIRYQPQRSATSDANVIHCCAEHSVYDPASGARVVSGPAPQPLAGILLDYDAATDELAAVGTVGAEQFDAFFRKYEFKLAMEYGQGKAKRPVGATSVVKELTQYCRQTIQC
jgi:arsenite oxidase small subunit